MTLADKVTLARLGLMPVIVAAYLWLPLWLCFWVAGWICALAEYTDLLDGRIARARGEVSDFGKLADPFCDVIYRIGVFLAFLLPAGGVAFAVGNDAIPYDQVPGQLIFMSADSSAHAGLVPWLPVFLMTLREVIAGALRAMTASKGLVLAARTSGKVKAWIQGATIITCLGFPAVFFHQTLWMLWWATIAAWLCALLSVASICEYFWVNRLVLKQLLDRKPLTKGPTP